MQYLSFKSVQSFWVGDVSLALSLENSYKAVAINSLVATLTQEPPDVSTIIYFIKLMKYVPDYRLYCPHPAELLGHLLPTPWKNQ